MEVRIHKSFNVKSHGPGPTTSIDGSVWVMSDRGKMKTFSTSGRWAEFEADRYFERYDKGRLMQYADAMAYTLGCEVRVVED